MTGDNVRVFIRNSTSTFGIVYSAEAYVKSAGKGLLTFLNAFITGYVNTDMNGNNLTDLSDIVITSNNASAFVGKVTP